MTVLDLWRIVRAERLLITASVLAMLLLAIVYISVAHTYYRVQLLAVPAADDVNSGVSGLSSRLGNLGSLVGVSNPMDATLAVNIATLKSRQFTVNFLISQGLLGQLAPSYWDAQKKNWRTDTPNAAIRGEDRAFAVFDRLRSISYDRDSQVATVSLEWPDSFAGAKLVNRMISDVNNNLRQSKLTETTARINYLRDEMENTGLSETRQMFSQILESQIQSIMMAKSRPDYAFRVIDPAVPTAEPSRPQRVVAVIMALLAGLIFGISLAFGKHYLKALRRAQDQNGF